MKKFFSVLLVIINIHCFAQAPKWFVSFSFGTAFGGPSASLKSQMKTQGYGDDAQSTFVIFGSGTSHYPQGGSIAFLAKGGKKISGNKDIYFVAGVSEKATIEGFKAKGWSDGIFGLFAGTYGDHVLVDYTAYQLGAGYMYSLANTKTKFGLGPSIYFLNYSVEENFSGKETRTSVVPGASFTARVPLGKEKKLFGTELFFDGNMAPSVKMKSNKTDGFQPKNVAMFSGNVGIAFTFRKKL